MRVQEPWVSPNLQTTFLWTWGVPMGPFLLPRVWQPRCALPSVHNLEGMDFHKAFL